MRLKLDNGTVVLIDTELDEDPHALGLAEQLGRPPWPRLLVKLGGDEPWPHTRRSREGGPARPRVRPFSRLLRPLAKPRRFRGSYGG